MKRKALLNYRLMLHTTGGLLLLESAAMLIPTLFSVANAETAQTSWYKALGITLGVALLLMGLFRKNLGTWGKREGYLVVASVWAVFSAFAALPFMMNGTVHSFADGFFESMSGFTTTGASILPNVEAVPRSFLLWRALMQWMGGMGIIVLSLAFGFGGMQLYMAEVSGPTKEKISPRLTQTAKMLWSYYLIITAVLILLLCIGGMDVFDSVCQAFATVSTGGFSTKAASISYWTSPFIQYVLIFFMLFCSLNFSVTFFLFNGKPRQALRDEECRNFLLFVGGFVAFTFVVNLFTNTNWATETAFRKSAFMISTAMSSTGFYTDDIMGWSTPIWLIFIVVMLLGGCSGSASGGLKMVRVSVLVKNSYAEFKRLLHPNAMIPLKFNKKAIDAEIINNALAFVSLYIGITLISIVAMLLIGLAPAEAIGSVVSSIGNVGMGFGTLSMGSYYPIPDSAKWICSLLMLMGRLEIFTVVFVFTPAFWRR
jgi:trk system potassium uptake protein TrkH